MARKRRKLSPELEKEISTAKKKVELITALINDIYEEEIQLEYKQAFNQVAVACIYLSNQYVANGVTEETETALALYKGLISQFEDEFEI